MHLNPTKSADASNTAWPLPPLPQVFLTTVYYKRWKWAPLKSRRIVVDVVN